MFILRLICLILGTALAVFYLLMQLRGRKYADMVADLEDFENKDLCPTGFAMQDIPALSLRGKLGQELRNQADLIYGSTYQEYYARLYYAKALSITVLLAAVVFLAAGLMKDKMVVLLFLAALVVIGVVWTNEIQGMKKRVTERSEACLAEFPNVISKLALLVSSGMILFNAWTEVAKSKEGPIYDLMRSACQDVKNGMSEPDAYYRFGILSDSQDIRKFSSMLVQSLEKGGAELTGFLMQQSKELWSQKRQRSLQAGDAAAAKLLIPTVLMLVGILIIILSSVFLGLTTSF